MSDQGPDPAAILDYSYRRGLLAPKDRAIYEYSLQKGLVKAPQAPAGVPQAPQGDVMAPESPGTPAASAVPDIANPLGAMGSAITRAPGELRRQQESFTARSKAAEEADRLRQGYEPGVDYASGTSFLERIQMQRMDNPAERRAMLESRYGPGNVFQDKGGRLYVQTPEGKRVSPEGEGFFTNLLAGIYGHAPQIAGGTAGAILGGAAGNVPGAIGGAALGTAAGKAADEFLKLVFGQQRKTLGEEVGALGRAGIEGAVGEGAGRIVTQIPGAVGRAFRYITGPEPSVVKGSTPVAGLPASQGMPPSEGVSLARSTAEVGGVPPARSLFPGLRSIQQSQDIAARTGFDTLESRNRRAVSSRLQQIIEDAGGAPDLVRTEMAEILNPAARIEATTAGAPIVGAVRQHAAQLEGEVANLARTADLTLTRQLNGLNALARRRPPGDLGLNAAGDLAEARSAWGRDMEKLYDKADELIAPAMAPVPSIPHPNYPNINIVQPQVTGVVPLAPMRKKAVEILDSLPKDAQGGPMFGDPAVLATLRKIASAPEKWPLGEAQRARSTLGDFAAFTNMTPGVAKRQFDELREAVDQGITAAGLDPAAAPAVRALREADAAYAEGVRKFGDATINRIVTRARTGIMPDPGEVARLMLRPGETPRAATIKRMVTPDVWRRVAAADWENNIIGPATDEAGNISAHKLAAAVKARDRGGLLEVTYGPAVARDIRLYSQRQGARGGNVPVENLAPDNFGQTMRQLEVAQREQDAFLQTNYLSALAKPGPLDDGAVNFVLQPGKEQRLIEADKFFGTDSPQMVGIRKQARKELLNSAIMPAETVGTTIAGKGLERALARWTPRQQEIMFQMQAEDIRRLAKEINFLFPTGKPEGIMGGMISGTILATPFPARWAVAAPFVGPGWIFSRPSVARALSEGLKPGPGQAATRETLRMIFRAGMAGQLDDDQPAPPVPIAEQITGARHAVPPAPVRTPRRLPAQEPVEYTEPPRSSVGGP